MKITPIAGLASLILLFGAITVAAADISQTKIAAESGDVEAQHQLAQMFQQGVNTAKDLPEADKWYRRAAEHDYAPAQVELGLMLIRGDGLPKNEAEAAA